MRRLDKEEGLRQGKKVWVKSGLNIIFTGKQRIHTTLLKHDYVAGAIDASHHTSSAHLWFQLLPWGVGWGIFPWELKLLLTMPHHNHQVVSFHFPSRVTFSDHWNHLGQQASAAHKDGRVNTPWQTSTNNSSLQACRGTFWEAFSLPLGGPFCIWPQLTMIFVTHTHIGFSSVFISLYLTHAFWDIFQMNSLSLSPWPCFRPCFGKNPNKKMKECRKLIEQHSFGMFLAILSGTQLAAKIP